MYPVPGHPIHYIFHSSQIYAPPSAWQEIPISIEENKTTLTVKHTSIYALTGSEEPTNGGDSPPPTPQPTLPAQEPPGDFTLTHDATVPDTDGTFVLNWTESSGADNFSIYKYESYITNYSKNNPYFC